MMEQRESIKRSELSNNGMCNIGGVMRPDYCPSCKNFDPSNLCYGHDCGRPAKYACLITRVDSTRLVCEHNDKGLPVGYCYQHALEHAKRDHRQWGSNPGKLLSIFVKVEDA